MGNVRTLGTLKDGKEAAPCGMDSLIRTSRWKPRLAAVDLVYMWTWKNYNMFKGATAAGRLCAGNQPLSNQTLTFNEKVELNW